MNGSSSLTDFLFSFEGRIGRQTFWLRYVLPVFIAGVIVTAIDGLIGLGGILAGVFQLAILWPSLAVYAKRWHIENKLAEFMQLKQGLETKGASKLGAEAYQGMMQLDKDRHPIMLQTLDNKTLPQGVGPIQQGRIQQGQGII